MTTMAPPTYTHTTQPHAVASRKKYREPSADENVATTSNIMFDKRVVRGNTYAAQILPATAQSELEASSSQKLRTSKRPKATSAKPDTPSAVEGRKHIDVQTEQYLEELTDRPVEVDIDTQTDAFMDQLPAPIFIPMKTGVDAETQVEDGELFDFDAEVEPILEVLVGKTLEQSMMEVMEEEELSNMRAHQEHFEQVRNAELAEVQRLEEAEKRRFEEKERRVAQELERKQREKQVSEKVAARTFTKGFLSELQSSVVANLQDAGFFYDPLEAEVKENFMPWLLDSMAASMDQQRLAREIADDLIEAAGVRQALMQAEAAKLRPPSPPATTHYEDPKGGCQSDEVEVSIQGIGGDFCSPKCSFFKKCPTDIPTGVTAAPQCALQDSASHEKYCALICSPTATIVNQKAADAQCGTNASCKSLQLGLGVCTYDD